jgi:hypothetical protein
VSLHKGGDWHIKLNGRKVQVWRRPNDNSGIVNGIMVLVDPFGSNEPFKNKAVLDPDINWVALPPFGKLSVLIIVLATVGTKLDFSRFPVGDRILAKLEKKNGELVLLIAHDMILSPQISQRMATEREKFRINIREGRTTKANFMARAVLTLPPGAPGEMPAIYDLSLDWGNVSSDFEWR